MATTPSLYGQKFNKLTVIGLAKRENYRSFWECICECGNKTVVREDHLKSGSTKSCGCYLVTKNIVKNGKKFNKPMYNLWRDMVDRCTNKNNKRYSSYGGRGITVCDKWLTFYGFYRDMGDKPSGKSLDRIDNNKGYSRENCRWATPTEQNNNKRNSHYLTFNGKTQTITQWARELNINKGTLQTRIVKQKWPIERALSPFI